MVFGQQDYSRGVKLQMKDESSPFSLLEEISKALRYERFPMVDGIGPTDNLFLMLNKDINKILIL